MAVFLDLVLDFFLFLCFAGGSSSLGYLFLRSGWPKIRVLKKSYKKGWSVIFGAGFSVAVALVSAVFGFFGFFGFGFREFFFIFIALSFFISILALTGSRKFLKKQVVRVSVPGSYIHAKVVAAKARNRLELDPSLAIVDFKDKRIERLEQKIEKTKTIALSSKIREKNPVEQKRENSVELVFKKILEKPLVPLESMVPKNVFVKKETVNDNSGSQQTRGFVGLKTRGLFEEENYLKEKIVELDEQEKEPVEKENSGVIIHGPEKENNSFEPKPVLKPRGALQKMIDDKKKKIKFLKEEG